MSLQNLIVERDAQVLDQWDRLKLERHLQKLTKAAQTFLIKNALQSDQIQFLLKTNDEAKVRRSTKSLVLGKARVVSYEDLVAARPERAKKDAAKEGRKKKNLGRKRKNNLPGADSPQSTAEMPALATFEGAPVARMW
ncbi:hypothetical protein LTR49_027509 [Elasticomyces elasticus]|nr:hypothetical protein LTR49_027509 [Elasticomyces elasticus]